MKHAEKRLLRAAEATGSALSRGQLDSLTRYGDWLISEAIPAGGLGPGEANRIVDRHLADSLVFARWIKTPRTLVDVGSGVGLPGIPLAIAHPDVAVTLLDGSQKRADLARRAARILTLDVVVVHEPWESHRSSYDAATFRAAMNPELAMVAAQALLGSGGVAIIGLNRGPQPIDVPVAPSGVELEVVETPDGVLDSPAWHLRMTIR